MVLWAAGISADPKVFPMVIHTNANHPHVRTTPRTKPDASDSNAADTILITIAAVEEGLNNHRPVQARGTWGLNEGHGNESSNWV